MLDNFPPLHEEGEKRAGKKGGKIGGSGEKKRKRRRKETYGIFIYNVLKQVQPDVGVSAKAMSIVNSFVNDISTTRDKSSICWRTNYIKKKKWLVGMNKIRVFKGGPSTEAPRCWLLEVAVRW